MSELSRRIRHRREELGLSQEELADRMGYRSKSSITKLEKGINDLPQSKLEELAAALHTTSAWLLGLDIPAPPPGFEPLPVMAQVPLVGSIACGTPILAEENLDGTVEAPDHVRADFALRCKGDSMINARIFDGDIVYIRQQESVEHGEIAAVLIGDDATLKRVYIYDDCISLEAENPQYKPMVYRGEEMNNIRILGKAVAFTSVIR